jgi:hypothetical protein
VDTEKSQHLVNRRMAYVAVSRGRYDSQIYTNNKEELAQDLNRDASQSTAIGQDHAHAQDTDQKIGPSFVGHEAGQQHDSGAGAQGHSAGEGRQGQAVGE